MTTNATNTDQQVAQSETLEQIAERIEREYSIALSDKGKYGLFNAILSALRNERERAAKLADKQADSLRRAAHVVQQPTAEALRMAELAIVSVENVARAIREGR